MALRKVHNSLLIGLIVFLPISAWLVSFTGSSYVSLGRDALLGLLFVVSLFLMRKPSSYTALLLALGFIVWGLLCYFWREESLAQYLRGVRFVLGPVSLLAILLVSANSRTLQTVRPYLLAMMIVVVIAGFVEYFFPEVFRYTLASGTQTGNLEQVHYADQYQRMQATFAGPNALGLYLLVGLLTSPFWLNKLVRPFQIAIIVFGLVALALTFSRSSYIGLVVGAIALSVLAWRNLPDLKRWLVVSWLVFLAGLLLITFTTPSGLVRPASNEIRLQQYERIWADRSNIGLIGRGIGSAGLVSQYRLDGGANNYSENTYLDTFEGLGLIGALIFLSLWIATIVSLFKKPNLTSKIVASAGLGMFVAAFFINQYTGQAGIWLFWLLVGSALGKVEGGEDGIQNRA